MAFIMLIILLGLVCLNTLCPFLLIFDGAGAHNTTPHYFILYIFFYLLDCIRIRGVIFNDASASNFDEKHK